MATQGAKKRDLQRTVQKVHLGASVSSVELSADLTSTKVEIGFPAEKLTLVTTGDLVAQVTPKIGGAAANAAIAATTTTSTTVTSNMFSVVEISRTSGTGQVLILAK